MSHQDEVAKRIAQLRREKSAREHRDVLQEEIASGVSLSVVTYGRYENGKRRVPDEVIIALAAYYGVSPAFIRYGVQVIPGDQQAVKTYSAEEIARFDREEAEKAARASNARTRAARRKRSNGGH